MAIANKAWAVLAIGPVLLALEQCRWRVPTIAGAIGAVFVLPFFFAGDGARTAVMTAGNTYGVFQRWQIWWPLGETGHVIRGMDGLAKAPRRPDVAGAAGASADRVPSSCLPHCSGAVAAA